MSRRVAFATCLALPYIQNDDELLRDSLVGRGITVRPCAWDDPAVDWSAVDLCLIRSTWDYQRRRDEFVAWADRVASVAQLWNPADVVRWNTDKRYLRDLTEAGVPAVPTVWLPARQAADLDHVLRSNGWDRVVIKPSISASSEGTMLAGAKSGRLAQDHLDQLLLTGSVMVQPYLESVETERERSLVFIDGQLTHAVRRGDVFGQDHRDGVLIDPTPEEVAIAEAAVRYLNRPLLYARIDLMNDDRGKPLLSELELVEPSLFLACAPTAVERLARAIEWEVTQTVTRTEWSH